jgi:transcription elongation factor Elf1
MPELAHSVIDLSGKQTFPCPICTELREVKLTKKKKPYITCDPCGIQLLVRGPAGISSFQRMIDSGTNQGLWTTLKGLEPLYRLKCPACGCRFWIKPNLVKTSMFDGSLRGFRCPEKKCGATVPWKEK